MLSCKEATKLMSAAQDRPLSMSEKMQLRIHLMMCAGCVRFREQMDFLRQACKGYLRHKGFKDEP